MSDAQPIPEPRDLHPASQGEDVSSLQTALFNAGYNPGPVDGTFGPATTAAVKEMQRRNGQHPDGIVGPATWRALSNLEGAEFLRDQPLRRTLHPASEGEDVALAQEALIAVGLDPGETDGVYRPGTEAAVKRFQNNERLKVTGILDEPTRLRILPVRIGNHLLTASAGEVMTQAVRLTGNNPENVPGPASVLVAALKIAVEHNRDPVAVEFCDRLPGLESSRSLPERERVLVRLAEEAHLVSNFDLLDSRPIEFDRHMRWPLPQLLGIADGMAQGQGSRWVDVAHLLVAAVSGRAVVLPPGLAAVVGLVESELGRRLGEAIAAIYPSGPDESLPPWWAEPLDIFMLSVPPAAEPSQTASEMPQTELDDEPASEPFLLSGGLSGDAVPSLNAAARFEDALDVQTYVSMLALAIADRNTPMPLSIGLFGEWGTGKSYFMGLLKQEVEMLSERAGEPDSPFLSDVVHISFNAWHYSDANLWASLADEIFEQLAGRSSGADSNDNRREKLRDELGRTLNKRKELEASTEQAKARAEELRTQLETERAKHQASARSLATTLLGDPGVKEQLDIAADKLGLDQHEEAQRLADELAGTGREARVTWQLLATSKWSPAWAVTVAVVLLASLGALLIADGVEFKWAGLAGIGAAVAALTRFLSGVRQGLVALRKGVSKAKDLKRTATNKDLNARIKELQAAEANVQVASAQLEEVVAKVGQLGRELAELNPGSRLYSFLAEKAASVEYQRQLGIVSMIRKDFEQLVALMTSWAQENAEPPAEGVKSQDRPA